MARKYKKSDDPTDDIVSAITGIFIFCALYFGYLYYYDIENFWYQVIYYVLPVLGLIAIGIVSYVFYLNKRFKSENQKSDGLIEKIKNGDFKITVNNFIDRFGKEGKKGSWEHRGYVFEWDRLRDFRDILNKGGFGLATDNFKDVSIILKYFIDVKERNFLNNGILNNTTHKFSDLNKDGSDLEHLIVRLYNAMGYVSKRTGGSGDQGSDVIASKNSENILIQAKCYNGSVSNQAVQQASAALAYHGCNKAVVITNSFFTPGAVALAKANSVELIDGERLKNMLAEHLQEVWL